MFLTVLLMIRREGGVPAGWDTTLDADALFEHLRRRAASRRPTHRAGLGTDPEGNRIEFATQRKEWRGSW